MEVPGVVGPKIFLTDARDGGNSWKRAQSRLVQAKRCQQHRADALTDRHSADIPRRNKEYMKVRVWSHLTTRTKRGWLVVDWTVRRRWTGDSRVAESAISSTKQESISWRMTEKPLWELGLLETTQRQYDCGTLRDRINHRWMDEQTKIEGTASKEEWRYQPWV